MKNCTYTPPVRPVVEYSSPVWNPSKNSKYLRLSIYREKQLGMSLMTTVTSHLILSPIWLTLYSWTVFLVDEVWYSYIKLTGLGRGTNNHTIPVWQARGAHKFKLIKISRCFPHSWRITGFVTRLTRRVSLEEQELPTLTEHLSSLPVFSGVRVTRSLVYMYVL